VGRGGGHRVRPPQTALGGGGGVPKTPKGGGGDAMFSWQETV